ncbi:MULTISPECIES: ABC transporter substrate-binding protein [Microbacterium]|uniref:ABC transporter substrate-binding protein n=1 Tax=Microbacterium sp. ZOR0019 TaxID=1339233 RepID=UPI00064801D6|nr:ABC transporter substrate-binding protein [Microbacterium sp. ZOR0019]
MNRPLVLAALVSASALLLASCASADASGQSVGDGGDAVTLVHPSIADLEIEFDAQPENIVMDCYAYSSLHEYGIEPVALFGYECDNPFVMGDADISGIEVVGKDGEIDVEKLAELRPDAIVGQGHAEGWAWFDEDVNAQITRVAPFVALPGGDTIDGRIADTREIAAFFGGDVASEAIVQSDEDLETAKEAFRTAIADSGLTLMLTSPAKEMLYTGVGFAQADLLEGLGATIVGADAPENGNPWGQVAWEDASSYPADVLLVEGYSDDFSFSADLWDALPAVRADQLGAWSSKGAMTASTYAAWLSDVADLVSASRKVA